MGYLDLEIMATVTEDEVRGQVARVRAVNADVPLSIFILTGAGDDPRVQGLKAALANGFLSRFVGEPEQVAEALNQLGEIGIDRVQLTELVPGSHAALSPYLLSG